MLFTSNRQLGGMLSHGLSLGMKTCMTQLPSESRGCLCCCSIEEVCTIDLPPCPCLPRQYQIMKRRIQGTLQCMCWMREQWSRRNKEERGAQVTCPLFGKKLGEIILSLASFPNLEHNRILFFGRPKASGVYLTAHAGPAGAVNWWLVPKEALVQPPNIWPRDSQSAGTPPCNIYILGWFTWLSILSSCLH